MIEDSKKLDSLQKNFTTTKDAILEQLNIINSHDPDLSPTGRTALEQAVALIQDLAAVVSSAKKGVVEPIPQAEVEKQEKESKGWDKKNK